MYVCFRLALVWLFNLCLFLFLAFVNKRFEEKKFFVANTGLLCDFVYVHLYFCIVAGFHWFLFISFGFGRKNFYYNGVLFLRLQILHELKVSKRPRKQTHLRYCSLATTISVAPLLLYLFSLGVTNRFVIFLYCEVIYSLFCFNNF